MRTTTKKATGPVFVGLDYHTQSVQVCVLDRTGAVLLNQACENYLRAIRDTVARFGADVRAAIEACSGSADLAEELVTRAGWMVDLAHPGYVAQMKATQTRATSRTPGCWPTWSGSDTCRRCGTPRPRSANFAGSSATDSNWSASDGT